MGRLKNMMAGKGIGYYLLVPAIACGIAAVLMYRKTGITQFNPELSTAAIVCGWVAVGLCVFSLVLELKPVKYAAYLLFLFAFLAYVKSQITYIANVFVSIDGNTFTGGFIATVVLFLVATVLALLAGALTTWRPWKKKTEEA